MRKEYSESELTKSQLVENPIDLLESWISDAVQCEVLEPNAMVLATASKDGVPSSRTVLLKGLNQEGLVFYTNYTSRKSIEIGDNPRASVTFLWKELERQVTVEGSVSRIKGSFSEEYFRKRPRESQLSAWASRQDQPVESRKALENAYEEAKATFENQEIPCPHFWGGFIICPTRFDFWKGRANRLSDRFVYTSKNDKWHVQRVYP